MSAYDIGFLGGGQLARMSIMAAQRMGLRCLSLDGVDSPASQVADSVVGALNDPAAIAQLLGQCDRVTWDSEFVPVPSVRQALGQAGFDAECIVPGLVTMETVQDKYQQRLAYVRHGVPGPQALELHDLAGLAAAVDTLGLPLVLKSRFGGYDGKGTRTLRTAEDVAKAGDLAISGGWMAEGYVSFQRELAVMVCRAKSQTVCFPTVETVQADHVCDLVFPAGVDASDIAVAAVVALGGYGLFGVELFELSDGSFMVNETAPRPHNSGHYTLDWGGPSQFEMHTRLVTGLPLGTAEGEETCMANLLGQEGALDWRDGLRAATHAVPDAHVHWYGKAQSKPGRKMGHINVVGADCIARAKAAREAFYAGWTRP